VCGEAWKRNLIQAAFFTGWLLGGAGFGWLADEYGARAQQQPRCLIASRGCCQEVARMAPLLRWLTSCECRTWRVRAL